MTLKIGKCKIYDDDYPKLLRYIHNPPRQLYYHGNFRDIDFNKCISIVGSRGHSKDAEFLVRELIKFLAPKNIIVVSGLASGIDTLVHRECLNNSIRTLAVMPMGLLKITPQSNKDLYWEIVTKRGLGISEDCQVEKYNKYLFPRRNRIIAGLSRVTIVIEAGIKSGALITADLAFNENRTVFAYPGSPLNHFSMGTNLLIKELKANMLIDLNEIMQDYGF